MISNKTFEEVQQTLKKLGFQKTDFDKVDFNDIYLNFSFRTDFDFNTLPYDLKIPTNHNDPFILNGEKFENKNNAYDFYQESENILIKWDFYFLKNEYFGWDSTKLNYLDQKNNSINRFPNIFRQKAQGIKQTLLFVSKEPIDGKAEFFYYPSLYPCFVYGDETKETQKFYLAVRETIKEIFGWPITNYRGISNLDNNNVWTYSIETVFNGYVNKYNIKEISLEEICKQKNMLKSYSIKKLEKRTDKVPYDNLVIDLIEVMTKFPNEIFEDFSFWNMNDLPHLKFYLLNAEYLEIEQIWKLRKYQQWDIDEILEFDPKDKFYALKMNVLFSAYVEQPILIVDQRNKINVLYKIIIPSDFEDTYEMEQGKLIIEKIFNKVNEINNVFKNKFDHEKIFK